MLITELIHQNTSQKLSHSAFLQAGKHTSYQEFFNLVSQLSFFYREHIGYQSRVALFSQQHITLAASFLALSHLRCTSIWIDSDLPTPELKTWLSSSKATHLLVLPAQLRKAKALLKETHLDLKIIEIQEPLKDSNDTAWTADPEQTPQENDPILLVRTAGLTGPHKYIAFDHQQISAAIQIIRDAYHLRSDDRAFTSLPWSHPFALIHALLLPLSSGITCILTPPLEMRALLEFLLRSNVTRLIGTPPFFYQILLLQSRTQIILPSLRSVTVGLGFLSLELRRTFQLLNVSVCQVYGQAEALWTIAMEMCPSGDEKVSQKTEASRGFVGKALPGVKYKILDQKGHELEVTGSAQGALAVSGPMIMKGYEDLTQETQLVLRGNWLHTGDIVKLHKVGSESYLNYLGRASEFELSHFKFDLLSRIDQVLKNIPTLKDCTSFFLKTSNDQVILLIAAVQAQRVQTSEQEILNHCKTELSQDMIPQAVVFTDEIPRDLGGNPIYSQLRAKFASLSL